MSSVWLLSAVYKKATNYYTTTNKFYASHMIALFNGHRKIHIYHFFNM